VTPAVKPGFELFDVFSIELAFIGLALLAAVVALTREHERPYSAALIYLLLGLGASAALHFADVGWIDPLQDHELVEHLTEFALIVSLFASGITINRSLRWREWRAVVGLLVIAMPLTIAALAAYGAWAMGLSFGLAIALGATLAPTDPVLAGGIGLGGPETRDESDARFTLTAEASLNDGAVAPFVLLGIFVLEHDGTDWLGSWLIADVTWSLAVPLALGAAAGPLLGRIVAQLRRRDLMSRDFDALLAIGAVLLVYGVADTLDTYGLLAVFATGVTFRRYEEGRDPDWRLHESAGVFKTFLELGAILLLGSLVAFDGLEAPGLAGWLIAPVALLVVRPVIVLLLLARSTMSTGERLFLAWFGVKGIASLYYVTFLLAETSLPEETQGTLFWTVAVTVMISIAAHGITATAISRRLLESRS